MKKLVTMLLIGAMALSAVACTPVPNDDESSAPVASGSSQAQQEVDLATLATQLKGKAVATEFLDNSADNILNDTGISADMYSEFVWFSEQSGLSSEMVAIFKAADGKAEEVKTKLQAHLQFVLNTTKEYDANNYAMAQAAVLETKGAYVYLVISPNVDDIAKAIRDAELA